MIKAIETKAFGYRFRSRLEARWASFFARLGLSWEYEPEGYDLDGVPYLPDFRVWTPQKEECWYEVKPYGTDSDDKFDLFRKAINDSISAGWRGGASRNRFTLLSGTPAQFFATLLPEKLRKRCMCPRCGFVGEYEWFHMIDCDVEPYERIDFSCYDCDSETPSGVDMSFRVDGIIPYALDKGWLMCSWTDWHGHCDRVSMAAAAATSERFCR